MTPQHWLNIATHGLETGAAARVRAEYLAYLQDALEAGESVAAVLREWGDPHGANGELKKAHLTTREARYLPAGYAPTWTGLETALREDALILGLWTAALVRDLLQKNLTPAAPMLLGLGLLLALLRWFVLSHGQLSRTARAILWWFLNPMSLMGLAFAGLLGWYFVRHGAQLWAELPRGWWVGLPLLAVSVYYISRLFTALTAARKAETQGA